MTNENTIALVTGANKGIGRQVAEQLAARGLTVLVAARDLAQAERAVTELRAEGRQAHPLQLDVTDPDSVRAAAERVDRDFGRLDVLVNNAGIARDPRHPEASQRPSTADLDTVRTIFETNVFGVITVTNAFLPLLRRSSAARIVNVSSSVGSLTAMTEPGGQLAELPPGLGYVPSKTAVNSLTVQYAKELRAEGILVNAACPGYCATDLNGHHGFRTPAQGATAVVELATLGPDGPTGVFRDENGPIPW